MTDPARPRGLVVDRVTAASWRTDRDVRLAALLDSPRAVWVQYADADGHPAAEGHLVGMCSTSRSAPEVHRHGLPSPAGVMGE